MTGFNLLVAHCAGDYLIQNDWMAKNKKSSSIICLVHAVSYGIPFFTCGLNCMQVILIIIQHFLQDRTNFVNWYMEKAGKSDFAKPPLSPWSIFAVDNSFHLLWIAMVANINITITI